jgi:predicted acyl esterase
VIARRSLLALAAILLAALAAAPANAETVAQNGRFTASDGVELATTLTGEAPLAPRPTIVEFSPYGRGSTTFTPSPGYNSLLVQIRGTGDSDGHFDALGPRTQKDVSEVLRWACHESWSDGNLGFNGFSASAITIYNSLHRRLPCVRAAVLKSGTFELYRDLLYPGGVNNMVPGAGVVALIGFPAAVQGLDRLARDPASGADIIAGLSDAGLSDLLHPTLDGWWHQRGFRGDVNHLPILMIDGFFDVESRGAFQAFRELRGDGAHLVVVGAHDGAPANTDGGAGESAAWFDRYVRGVDNGVAQHPRVQLWLANGDREDMLAGDFSRVDGRSWPLPGTRWSSLALDPTPSGTATSLNDGTLTLGEPAAAAHQSYPALASIPFNSDPYNTAIIGGFGVNQLATAFPVMTEMTASEPTSLTYTTAPLRTDVLAAGPLSLDVRLATTAPETAIWAVVSDVDADGVAHPVASGRLLSSFPGIDRKRSLRRGGEIVQPYSEFDSKDPAAPGTERRYRVELWPIGNRFAAGDRLRLTLLAASGASQPVAPAVGRRRQRLAPAVPSAPRKRPRDGAAMTVHSDRGAEVRRR